MVKNVYINCCFFCCTVGISQVCKRMAIHTEESKSEGQTKLSQKSETHSASVVASPAEREDMCEDMSTHSDNHSGT